MPLEIISELPAKTSTRPPLLFIHGAWHGAWCWQHFLPFFAKNGYASYALSFRGHGNSPARRSLRMTSVRDYVEDIEEAVAQLPAPPIFIAHSMGSFVMHHYLRKHPAAGVVFVAPVPPRGAWLATWHAMRRHPLVFAYVNLIMSLYPLVSTVERAKEWFFSPATSRDLVAQYHPLLGDESYRAYLDMLFRLIRKRSSTFPALILGASDDALFYENDVRATAEFYNATSIMIADIGHDMMLDTRWPEVAATILRWLPVSS